MGTDFDKKIKPILKYVGFIGATMMGIAYIAIVLILVFGFTAIATFRSSLIFALVNAVMGFTIIQFFKIQGIDLAKNIEENKIILKQYTKTKIKEKKLKSIEVFWKNSIIADIIVKGITFLITTMGIIYIVIIGSQNYTWILLAFVNLIMFGCFGLLSLIKAYDFFNEEHIPYIIEKIKETENVSLEEIKNNIEEKGEEECLKSMENNLEP